MKTCTVCGVRRPSREFHKAKNRRRGRHSQCRECYNRKRREARSSFSPNKKVKAKVCKDCGGRKLLDQFYRHYNSHNACCKVCHEKYSRRHDRTKLLGKYALSVQDYLEMADSQGGVCAICGLPQLKKALAVDHDHSTGMVRGLLCQHCNWGLGHFRDNVSFLKRAIDYLQ